MLKRLTLILLLATVGAGLYLYQPDMPLERLKSYYANEQSQFVTVDGMDVHFRIEGEGPTLLLLHGTSASLHTWDAWTELLSSEFKIVRLDLPAFGLTGTAPNGDYSMAAYSKFLEKFVVEVQLDSFYLAGNSLGGSIAVNYTLDYPNRVKKLILIDASGYPRTSGKRPWIFRVASDPFIGNLLKNFTPRFLIKSNLKQVYFDDNKISEDLVDRYFHMLLRPGNRQAFIDRSNTKSVNRMGDYPNINIPVLVQFGKHDTWIPLEHAKLYQRDLPNSRLIIYDNAGHVPMEEIPLVTSEDAKKFLLK